MVAAAADRYVASGKDRKKRSLEKQTHCNYGARKSEERERGASNRNKLLGQLAPGRMAILGPCPGPAGSHIIASCFFPELGGYLIFEITVILVVFKLHIKILRTCGSHNLIFFFPHGQFFVTPSAPSQH
jgi:hypothetical protein